MHRRQALKQLGTLTGAAALHPYSGFASELCETPAASETTSYPASIHINQVGYLPSAAKIASVANPSSGAPQTFRIVNPASGAEALTGTLSAASVDEASGDNIALADFSALTAPGTYRVEAAGLVSDTFVIAPDAYKRALYLSTRAFYGQRCGCAVDLGGGYQHPICHTEGAYHPSSGRKGKVKHHGGWHDAGDYGRYVVNSGISTATLMYALEMYPSVMTHLSLDIPKHQKHLPDILAEVRWNLDWMISLQDSGHGGDGGVWHKQTSEQFCSFIMPQADTLTSYITGSGHAPYKTTAATADLAATAAIAARVFKPFDKGYADHCLEVARKAWTWANTHPDQIFKNPAGVGTGGYGDSQLSDELLWASAELFRTTLEAPYEARFLALFHEAKDNLRMPAPTWANLFSLGCFTYMQTQTSTSDATESKTLIKAAFAASAKQLVGAYEDSGYGNTLRLANYGWGSNSDAANQSFLLLMADTLSPDPALRAVALSNLHYLLGRNCHGVSWVTQVGTRPFLHPHHRPSAADGIAAPWPGLLSGGPNRRPGDEVARTLPKLPPMRMWLDDQRAYSLNEIAINWNAPLVLLLAAANAESA